MYEDFKFLNYFKTAHKIKKIKELIDRLFADTKRKLARIDSIEQAIHDLKNRLDNIKIEKNFADLTITSIVPTYYSNWVGFKITVKNMGEVASTVCKLKVDLEELSDTLDVPALNVNESIILNFSYPYNPSGTEKLATLTANVDVNNEVMEINEENNIAKLECIIKTDNRTGIIVHVHNPEGIEINSIKHTCQSSYYYQYSPRIYINDTFIHYGASNIIEHNNVDILSPGVYTIKVTYNNMIQTKTVEVFNNKINTVIFLFNRVECNIMNWLNNLINRDLYQIQSGSAKVLSGEVVDKSFNDVVNNFEVGTRVRLVGFGSPPTSAEIFYHIESRLIFNSNNIIFEARGNGSLIIDYGMVDSWLMAYTQVSPNWLTTFSNLYNTSTLFKYYHSQLIFDGFYEDFSLQNDTYSQLLFGIYNYRPDDGYVFSAIDASQEITKIKSIPWQFSDLRTGSIANKSTSNDSIGYIDWTHFDRREGSVRQVKFSSVPYDVLEMGI